MFANYISNKRSKLTVYKELPKLGKQKEKEMVIYIILGKKRHLNDQQEHWKIFNITNHQENENQNVYKPPQ